MKCSCYKNSVFVCIRFCVGVCTHVLHVCANMHYSACVNEFL
jgi:hypothetical protein